MSEESQKKDSSSLRPSTETARFDFHGVHVDLSKSSAGNVAIFIQVDSGEIQLDYLIQEPHRSASRAMLLFNPKER